MLTLSKIITEAAKTPIRVGNSYFRRYRKTTGKPPLFLFGFDPWKTFMSEWFPDHNVIMVPLKEWPIDFQINWRWQILADPRSEVMAWQYRSFGMLRHFCEKHNRPFHFVEDGFLRSIQLGALRVPPMSLSFDTSAMHFDAGHASDLEKLLASYDFANDQELMTRANSGIARLLSLGISKYNSGASTDVESLYGPKDRKRVLVLGQVERDASIRYGCKKGLQNNDLVWLARRENPDAQIIYKPHPEVMQGTASPMSDPALVSGAATILTEDISLSDSFATVDHVYTITSLAGFEALLRGIPVTVFGAPFYSGWGQTDDRQLVPRRDRQLSVEEIFAGAYLLYAQYFDPIAKRRIGFEEALDILSFMKAFSPPDTSVTNGRADTAGRYPWDHWKV